MVPAGDTAPVARVSVTVAVQVFAAPLTTVAPQVTDVDDGFPMTLTVLRAAEEPRCLVSPLPVPPTLVFR